METLFNMVGQVVIAANEDLGLVVLWNRSATLNLYSVDGGNMDALDCKTLGDQRHDGSVAYHDAMRCAEQWLEEIEAEGNED